MTCKSVQSRLSAYIDGELSGYEMLRMRAHIHDCADCSNEMEQLRNLKWVIGNIPENAPKEDFAARLKENVFAVQPKTRARILPVAMISGIAFFAALAVSLASLHAQHSAVIAHAQASAADQPSFDVSRDQAYESAGDAFSDNSLIITASAPVNGSR